MKRSLVNLEIKEDIDAKPKIWQENVYKLLEEIYLFCKRIDFHEELKKVQEQFIVCGVNKDS